jgi:glycosyltransferase involved in cell wall biosynthesis
LKTKISIVIPVYASEAILPDLVVSVDQVMTENNYDYELILVCDASPDNSWSEIKRLKTKFPTIKGILLRNNSGQHNAVLAGLAEAKNSIVVTMDDDLQHDPRDIPKLIEALVPETDVVYGAFRNRNHPIWKKAGSKFNNGVATFVLGKPQELYLSPFRVIRQEIVLELLEFKGPFVYIDGLILAMTNSIKSVEVAHYSRKTGKSHYGFSKSIKLWLEMTTTTSIRPIRMMTLFGGAISLVSIFAGVFLIFQRLFLEVFPAGWASVMVTVLLFSGVQLLSLGLVGEYLGKTAMAVNGLPQSLEKERT